MTILNNLIVLVIPIIAVSIPILIGLAFLQVFLSKKESKWLGLILPGCSIFLSLTAVFGFSFLTIAGTRVYFIAIAIFVIFNIPTLIYLAIYKYVRTNTNSTSGTSKKNQEIQKMNIQDLE